jgi:hypothetical protein
MPTTAFLPDIQRPEPGPGEFAGLTAQVGDLVRWRDPRTAGDWVHLQVEIVYALQGKAAVALLDSWGNAIDRKRVSLLDCVVTRRKGESA